MLFSAKAEYACLAVLELAARHGGQKPVPLTEVADRHGIPQRFLVQILLQLKGAGLVASTRGAAGGYQLARDPGEITLADVMDAVDPPEPPAGGRKGELSALAAALREKWDGIAADRRRVLEETTVADLVAAGQGLQYVI